MTKETNIPETAYFPLRSGEGIKQSIDILARDPERPLDNEELFEVLSYESLLLKGTYTTSEGIDFEVGAEQSLDDVHKNAKYLSTRHEITADYFLSPEGSQLLEKIGIMVSHTDTPQDILGFVRQKALSTDRSLLEMLAEKSEAWAEAQIVREIVDGTNPEEVSPDFVRSMVFDSFDKLAHNLTNYGLYREFYLEVLRDLESQPSSKVTDAKKAIARLYVKVVNGELASIYPDALAAFDQIAESDNDEAKTMMRNAWPSGEKLQLFSAKNRHAYIVGLDRIRNGTVLESKHFSAISSNLRALFEETTGPAHHDTVALFTPEQTKRLSEVKLDAYGMQALCKDILKELGLLSSEPESTYYKDRPHRAADGLWQVVVKDDISAMGAEDPEGVLEIPRSFHRSLTKASAPVGAVSGAAHEITHIYQLDNLRKSSGGLALTKTLRGRSSLSLREAGGVSSEHPVLRQLFDIDRPDSPHYMRAIDVLEQGGKEKAAVRAFYESYRQENPNEALESAAKVAVSRVKRLARRYGGFNSQPLNYAQTALIVREAGELNEMQRAKLFSEGALDLPDMVELHQFGLTSSEPTAFPADRFISIMEKHLRKMV